MPFWAAGIAASAVVLASVAVCAAFAAVNSTASTPACTLVKLALTLAIPLRNGSPVPSLSCWPMGICSSSCIVSTAHAAV